MQKPSPVTYPGFFHQYINEVPQADLQNAFNLQLPIINNFLSSISEEESTHAYAAGKWTIKEVLQHIIDTERIFSYRALCFSRGEKKMLPGFEQDDYVLNGNGNEQTWHSLSNELLIVRQSTHLLFNSFTDRMLLLNGNFNNMTNTTAGMGFIILGHFYHHQKVIEQKYL